MKKNIYLYDHSTTAALITSPVHKVTATSESGPQPSIYVVTIKQPVTSDFSDVEVTVPVFISEDASGFFYHTFLYRNLGDYACFHIVQVPPKLNEKYDVYLRAADFPTLFKYDAVAEVSVNRDYMACIPPQKLSSVGVIHIGLKPTPIPSMSFSLFITFYLQNSFNIVLSNKSHIAFQSSKYCVLPKELEKYSKKLLSFFSRFIQQQTCFVLILF